MRKLHATRRFVVDLGISDFCCTCELWLYCFREKALLSVYTGKLMDAVRPLRGRLMHSVGFVCVRVPVSWQQISIEMIFDLNNWRGGSSWCWFRRSRSLVKGHGQGGQNSREEEHFLLCRHLATNRRDRRPVFKTVSSKKWYVKYFLRLSRSLW